MGQAEEIIRDYMDNLDQHYAEHCEEENLKNNKINLLNVQVSGQQLAEQFHKLYEELAPQYGYETKKETRIFNPESNNGKLMIAVSEQILKWLSR